MADRLTPLPYEEWGDEAREVLPSFLRRRHLYEGPDARPLPNVLGVLARHLPLGRSWLAFNDVLAEETDLDIRLRELAILRVAWRTRSTYEWKQHVRMGSTAGLTRDHLYAVAEGPEAAVWTPVERALVRAVDESVDEHVLSDQTWAELVTELGERQVMEVLFLIGAYVCFAIVANSAAVPLDVAPEAIDAPELPG